MAKKSLFFTVFLFISVNIFSQNIDSLKIVAEKDEDIENIINAIAGLSDYYHYRNPDSAEFYLNIAINKLNFKEKEEYPLLRVKIFLKAGILYNEKGRMDTAILYLNEALNIAESLNDTTLIIRAKGNLGNSYMNLNIYDKAISYFTDVLLLAEERKDIKIQALVNGAMGNLYLALNKYDKSLSYYKKSEEFFRILKNTEGMALSFLNMATVYANMKKFPEALSNYGRANKLFSETENFLNSAKCISGIAKVYFKTGDYRNSVKKEKEALEKYKKYGAVMDISYAYSMIADGYIHLKEYNTAILYLDSASSVLSGKGNTQKIAQITDKLRICYDSLGNYKKAYEYSVLHKALYDSVFNEESDKRFSEMEVKYETYKKEKQLELYKKNEEILKKENRNRLILLISLSGMLVFSVLIFLLLYNRQKLKASIKESELENKLLRVQMNPHFIFNALSSIEYFIYKNEKEKSVLYISYFAKLIRLILESSRKNLISLKQELEISDYYVNFQRLKSDFKFTVNISENIDIENTLFPPMLIQPFIENSVKHGFTEEIKNPEIFLSLELKNNYIFVTIRDNGAGISINKNKKSEHKSLSAEITEERLENIFGKKIRKQNILQIVDLKEINPDLRGTEVRFKIPYVKEF